MRSPSTAIAVSRILTLLTSGALVIAVPSCGSDSSVPGPLPEHDAAIDSSAPPDAPGDTQKDSTAGDSAPGDASLSDGSPDGPAPDAPPPDAGTDADAAGDAGTPDAASDAAPDAPPDAGTDADAAGDAGTPDAASDAALDGPTEAAQEAAVDGAAEAGTDAPIPPACAPEGRTRLCGSAVGACTAGLQTCENGAWGPCLGGSGPSTETCDGIDNDCDNAVDEGCGCASGATQICGSQIGACTLGVQSCVQGTWTACIGDTLPAPEQCDGIDNDCNGAVDEGCACTSGEVRNCGTDEGTCHAGQQTCVAGYWGGCEDQVEPGLEVCDGLDNDCNGVIDDGSNACGGACPLGTAPGTPCDGPDSDLCIDDSFVCSGLNSTICSTGDDNVEACNGVDDDCSGGIDDGFECEQGTVGVSCTTSCGSAGTGTCTASCTRPAPEDCAAPAELCNGLDDDCMGGIDNGFACAQGAEGVACTTICGSTGQGTCTASCTLPAPGDCVPPVELCNGLDDDCVGGADNGFPCVQGATGVACATACGSTGTGTCGSDCSLPGPDACHAPAETCNGVDDDCDGEIDNGFACAQGAVGVPCVTSCGSNGVGTCTSQCSLPHPDDCVGPVETCNGQDDDCDGVVDNGLNACGGACALPAQPGDSCDSPDDLDDCTDDVYECDGLNAVRCVNSGADADGDGFSEWGGVCSFDCDDSSPHVSPLGAEVCNGVDDDCDGTIDIGTGFAALPVGIMLLFDGACPQGWTEVTAARNRLLRGSDGDSTYGETGGSDAVHSHAMAHTHVLGSSSIPSHTHSVSLGLNDTTVLGYWMSEGTTTKALSHSHGVGQTGYGDRQALHAHGLSQDLMATGGTAPLPSFREVVLCESTNEVHAAPAGALGLSEGACQPGWAEAQEMRGRFARGHDDDGQDGEIGGSDSHEHSVDHAHSGFTADSGNESSHYHLDIPPTGIPSSAIPFLSGSLGVAAGNHAHTVSLAPAATHRHGVSLHTGSTASQSHLPPFREVLFCRASEAVCPADGMMALFTRACPAGWSEQTAYRNLFLRGDDGNGVANETGGSATHSHSFGAHDHGGSTAQAGHSHAVRTSVPNALTSVTAGNGTWSFAGVNHRHSGTTATSGAHSHTLQSHPAGVAPEVANDPAWFEVVVCKRDTGGSGCGDGQCSAGEDCASCPADCGLCECGDSICDSGAGEGCWNCESDCGACCGDGFCASFEACDGCLADCGPCCVPFGADAAGYIGCEQFPPVMPCPDIRSSGTALSLADDQVVSVPIGFDFALHGVVSQFAGVSSNGVLGFPGTSSHSNKCLPAVNNNLYLWWDDLVPGPGGIIYETIGAAPNRQLAVQWLARIAGGPLAEIDVRAVLHETSNIIEVCYVDTAPGSAADYGALATAGLQGSSANVIQYSCNEPALRPGLMVRYAPP